VFLRDSQKFKSAKRALENHALNLIARPKAKELIKFKARQSYFKGRKLNLNHVNPILREDD
jgi:hypothetical protein